MRRERGRPVRLLALRARRPRSASPVMKRLTLLAPLAAAFIPWTFGQAPAAPPPAVAAVAQVTPRLAAPLSYGPSGDTLIARSKDDGVLVGFRKVYLKDSAPRFVVWVNRARNESGEDTKNVHPVPADADELMAAEVARMFGRVFGNAGARIAKPAVPTALAAAEPGARLVGEAGAKERTALAEVADIAIEVLISRGPLNAAEVSGEAAPPVPDLHATAIRLKDAAIVGRASAGGLLNKGVQAGRVIGHFNLRDIAVATAIALMEDMLAAKP